MDEQTRGRIEAVRSEIAKSDLPPEHKDVLQSMIDHAERCANGAPDKIAAIGAAVADQIIRDARREVRDSQRIEAAITSHALSCVKRMPPKTFTEFLQRLAADYPVAVLISLLWLVQRYGLGPVLSHFGIG